MKLFIRLSFLLFLSNLAALRAQTTEIMNARLNMPALSSNTPLTVIDNRFNGTGFTGTLFTNVSSKLIVEFGIDPTEKVFHNNSITQSTSTIQFSYILTDMNGVNTAPTTGALTVTYHWQSGMKDQDRTFLTFNNYYKITIYNITVTSQDQSNNNIASPQDLYLEAEVQATRILLFNQAISPPIANFGYNILNVVNSNTGLTQDNELDVYWDYVHGADEYELEWTYVDNYDASVISTLKAATDISYDFKHDATRIITKEQHYIVPLVYERGYVLFRLRAINYDISGNRFEGSWTLPSTLTSSTVDQFLANFPTNANSTANTTFSYLINPFEADKINWNCIRTFAENGKSGTGIDFQDGLMLSRQSIAKLNTDNKIITHTTLYDFQARPVIQTLPSPVNETNAFYGYKHKLNNYSATQAYDKYIFDSYVTGGTCIGGSMAMDINNSIGAAHYYSTANLDNDGFQGLLPDAKSFPFTQIEYVPDNTTRIARQSLPGPDHQLFGLGNHDIKYFYTQPSQNELIMMFGSEVGPVKNYHKTIQIDPNGQASVTYMDNNGDVIATALSGDKPNNVEAINSYTSSAVVSVSEDLTAFNTPYPNDNNYIMTRDFFANANETQTIDYAFTATNYSDACSPLCFDCLYQMEFSIKDDCGNDVIPPYNVFVGSPIPSTTPPTQFTDSTCSNGATVTFNITPNPTTVTFPTQGMYHIYKKLQVSTLPVATYAAMFIRNNTCIQTLQSFQSTALSQIDLNSCAAMDCATCSTAVNNYVIANPVGSAGYLPDAQIQQMLFKCQTLCTAANPSCESKTQQALGDLMPGGQYATYSTNLSTGIISSTDPYSIFNVSNSLNLSGSSYAYNNPPDVYNPATVFVPSTNSSSSIISLSENDYNNLYNESWANSLIKLHPEYCKLALECSPVLANSKNFDNTMLGINSYDEAYLSGYLNPFGSNCSSMANGPTICTTIPPCSTSVVDPIFATSSIPITLASGVYNVPMPSSLCNSFSSITLTSIPSSFGSGSLTGNIYQIATSFATGQTISYITANNIQFGADPCYKDMEWKIFCALYSYQKQVIYASLFNNLPIGTQVGCLTPPSGISPTGSPYSAIFINQDPGAFTAATFGNSDLSGGSGTTPGSATQASIAASCSTQCAGYISTWVQQIQSCVNSSNTAQTGLNMNFILTELANNLNLVCVNGCDGNNPFGASNIASPTTIAITINYNNTGTNTVINNISDFQGVFNAYYSTYPGIFDQLSCNSTLLPMPSPRGHSYSSTASTTPKLDPCGCDAVLTNDQNYLMTSGLSSGVAEEEYFFQNYNVHLPNYNTVLCACKKALLTEYNTTTYSSSSTFLQQSYIDAVLAPSTGTSPPNLLSSAQIVPAGIGCKNCKICSDINISGTGSNNLLTTLQAQFGSSITSLQDILNLPIPQSEITAFLNNSYNLNNTYTEWIAFLSACNIINGSSLPPTYYSLTQQAQDVLPTLNEMITDNFATSSSPANSMLPAHYPIFYTSSLLPSNFLSTSISSCKKLVLTASVNSTNIIDLQIKSPLTSCSPQINLDINLVPTPYNPSPIPITLGSFRLKTGTNIIKFYDLNWICLDGDYAGQPGSLEFSVKCDYYDPSNPTNIITVTFIGTITKNGTPVYTTVGQPCNGGQICSHDFTTPPEPPVNDCLSTLVNNALNNANTLYQQYITAQIALFTANYTHHCYASVTETSHRTYNIREYQYTLYYHDQAGNLVHTVPPKGVSLVTSATDIAAAFAYINNTSSTPLYPCHSLNNTPGTSIPIAASCGNNVDAHYVTNYNYNSLEEPIQNTTPDGGLTTYYYDNVGRIVASQNNQQAGSLQYSYTLYDQLGRIIQVGKLQLNTSSTPLSPQIAANPTQWATFVHSNLKMELSNTYYDNSINTTINSQFGAAGQQNLRNRVGSATYEIYDDNNPNTYSYATHFNYDTHGNVNHLIQDNPALVIYNPAFQFKHIQYNFELVSGNMLNVIYQRGQPDQFLHNYYYDADNRLHEVYTSADGIAWDKDEKYLFYQHGALARTETGNNQVHGRDYAYTIQNWVKGINSNILQSNTDIGKDGDITNAYMATYAGIHANFAKDASSFNLNYYANDFSPIKTSASNFLADKSLIATNLYTAAPDLFNGNISSMVSSIYDVDGTSGDFGLVKPQLNAYKYDQLHRITKSKSYSTFGHYLGAANDAINLSANQWNTNTTSNNKGAYAMQLTYDDNGNITTLSRIGKFNFSTNAVDQMDNFTYNYNAKTNQLQYITDGTTPTYDNAYKNNYANDIDNQNSGNYQYDGTGQLMADAAEEIDHIDWTAAHKVKAVVRVAGSAKSDLYYDYDAFGRRIRKTEIPKLSGEVNTGNATITDYVLDAQGNQMALYQEVKTTAHVIASQPIYTLQEQDVYGSARIGAVQHVVTLWTVGAGAPATATNPLVHTTGEKLYEITNHLGNVLTVITDRKLQDDFGADNGTNNTIDYYTADIASVSDYYAFGMAMPGRSYSGTNNYRFGHNGQEKDAEIFDGAYTAEYWEYDSRSGRRWERDPVEYAWQSPYATFNNNPIYFADPSGLEGVNEGKGDGKKTGDGTISNNPKGHMTKDGYMADETVVTAKKNKSGFAKKIGNLFKKITGSIREAAGKIVGKIKEGASNLWRTFGNFLDGIKGKVKEIERSIMYGTGEINDPKHKVDPRTIHGSMPSYDLGGIWNITKYVNTPKLEDRSKRQEEPKENRERINENNEDIWSNTEEEYNDKVNEERSKLNEITNEKDINNKVEKNAKSAMGENPVLIPVDSSGTSYWKQTTRKNKKQEISRLKKKGIRVFENQIIK